MQATASAPMSAPAIGCNDVRCRAAHLQLFIHSLDLRIANFATKSSYRTNALSQQFVRENAQTIDCRCFHSKDDWAERNWLASVTSRECKFSRREIAFWPDEHQDTARTMVMLGRIARKNLLKVLRTRLERSNQL